MVVRSEQVTFPAKKLCILGSIIVHFLPRILMNEKKRFTIYVQCTPSHIYIFANCISMKYIIIVLKNHLISPFFTGYYISIMCIQVFRRAGPGSGYVQFVRMSLSITIIITDFGIGISIHLVYIHILLIILLRLAKQFQGKTQQFKYSNMAGLILYG